MSVRPPHIASRAVFAAAALTAACAVLATTAAAALAAPSVTLTSSVNPSVSGQRTTLRATVTDPAVPTSTIAGTVTFSDGASALGSAAVANGRASLGTALPAGTHTLTATFADAGGGAPVVSAPVTQTVNPADTTTTITTTRPVGDYFLAGNIIATVRPITPGAGIPTGSVDFSVNGGWFWNAPLDARGRATLPLSAIYPAFAPGTYSITASYTGDANNNNSTTVTPVSETLIGITEAPVSTLAVDSTGKLAFTPNAFRLSSLNPVGCNVTITNTTSLSVRLAYGTPGMWKMLPGGAIGPGASRGVGVSMSNFTGYFTVPGAKNYIAIHCI